MALWLLYRNCAGHALCVQDWMSLLGLLITATAFTVGCYFAVMAVTVFSHVAGIQRDAKDIEKRREEIEQQAREVSSDHRTVVAIKKQMADDARTVADTMDALLNLRIEQKTEDIDANKQDQVKAATAKSYVAEARRLRALNALKNKAMDPFIRESRVLELCAFASQADRQAILKALKDDDEPDRIRGILKMVLHKRFLEDAHV
ncbi:MAG: hypothetical protein ACYDA8_00810 [Deferrisomatales bacterium]